VDLGLEDDDGGSCGSLKSRVIFESEPGTTYYAVISPISGAGPFGITHYELSVLPNGQCANAIPLEFNETIVGEVSDFAGSAWYRLVGKGDLIVVSTCTGNATLDNTEFDSVIDIHNGDCDNLRLINRDDESGACSTGKSSVIFGSVANRMYYIEVSEYNGNRGSFGLTVNNFA